MDELKKYCENVIKPLEEYREKIYEKYENAILFKNKYQELLTKMDNELLEKYKYLEENIENW